MNAQEYNLNIRVGYGFPQTVKISQDDVGRPLSFHLLDGAEALTIPSGATVTIHGTKPSGLGFTETCTVTGSTASIDTTLEMSQEFGNCPAELVVAVGDDVIGTANFTLFVERSPHPENTIDGTYDVADSIFARMDDLEEELDEVKDDITNLDDRVTALEEGGTGGDGLTEAMKTAFLQIAQKVAYIDEDGQDYYDALYDAFYPPAELVSISAVYTQSGAVYDTDSLEDLKTDLVVTAHYDDSTTENVTGYTLSGTLAVGTSTITVAYGGFTTTFSVEVSQSGGLPSAFTACDYVQSSGGAYIDTGIKELYGTIASFWGIFDAHVASTNTKTLWGYQGTAEGQSSSYRFTLRVTTDNEIKYYGATNGLSNAIAGWNASGKNEITVSLVDNANYPTFDVNGTQSTGNKAKTKVLAPAIGPFYLLADNFNAVGPGAADNAVDGSYVKCYGFKIYNVDGIVRDYVPCTRNSDSVAGFYDMVSETFYPSIGANAFTSGNDEA